MHWVANLMRPTNEKGAKQSNFFSPPTHFLNRIGYAALSHSVFARLEPLLRRARERKLNGLWCRGRLVGVQLGEMESLCLNG